MRWWCYRFSTLSYAAITAAVEFRLHCGRPRRRLPTVNRRIEGIRKLGALHAAQLRSIETFEKRADRLAELNVLDQINALHAMPLIRQMERPVQIHGWIFSMHDGRLKALTDPQWTLDSAVGTRQAAN